MSATVSRSLAWAASEDKTSEVRALEDKSDADREMRGRTSSPDAP
jgi:hypothetical protein